MAELPDSLLQLIDQETRQPADPEIHRIAQAACQRATQDHPDAVLCVLFYGSCLRSGAAHDSLVDLYLLVDSYESVHAGALMRCLNQLLPPNVYYIETEHEGRTVRAKYALMTLEQFARRVGPAGFHPYFWARFAQPTGILAVRDETSRQQTVAALAHAAVTLAQATRGLFSSIPGSEALWTRGFTETYRTELRAESGGRAHELYERYRERYDRIWESLKKNGLLAQETAHDQSSRRWALRRVAGKILSVLRLAKAAFTFTDGQAYLLWKIERHSGVRVEPTAWQKRHPLLSAPVLAWTLYRRGGFR